MSYGMKKIKIWILLAILTSLFLLGDSLAQNLNSPFPRIGQVYFYGSGAGHEIWKNHDFLAIRHYMGGDARKIKQKNPDVILMGANAGIAGTDIPEIIGEPLPEEWHVHYVNGERLKVWGVYWVMNITEHCPEVDFIYGRQKFYEFLAEFLYRNTDWNYFDGSYFDGWINSLIWTGYKLDQIDFNADGEPDGASNVNSSWVYGNGLLLDELRRLSGKLILAHEAVGQYKLNGNAFEFWSQIYNPAGGHSWNMQKAIEMKANCVTPTLNYANSQAPGTGSFFRADFTSALIVGAYFGHDEGSYAHRWTFLHDEYEANLGYPKGNGQQLEPNIWVRYFDNGVVLSNVSGLPKTVTADQLTGGPYYRFRGNQDPVANSGYELDSAHPVRLDGLVDVVNSDQQVVMDGIMLLKQPTILVTPIIIDNIGKNMTTVGQRAARYVGNWTQSKKGRYAYVLRYSWDDYGFYHAYSLPGSGENTATYRPQINVPGQFEVYEWHGSLETGLSAASNTPVQIVHKNGVYNKTINQTTNLNQWNSLGIFEFASGNSGYVKLSNNANGYVISDAIKFRCLASEETVAAPDDTTPPNEPRNLGLDGNSENSITLSWDPPSPASDGDVAVKYNVYRDNNFKAYTYNANYHDTGLEYQTTYYYEIFSVDDAGIESVSPAMGNFSTWGDDVPPELLSVTPLSLNTIEVVFNEPVDEETAENRNNYAVSNGIIINKAWLRSDTRTVHLKTSTQSAGQTYTVTVNNINDRAATPNTIVTNSQKSYEAFDYLFVLASADNEYEIYLNGSKIGQGDSWWETEPYVIPMELEMSVIAIKGIDVGGEAGLVVEIELGGKTFVSNENWKVTNTLETGWQTVDFSDNSWLKATSYGELGSPDAHPWADTPNGGIAEGMSIDKGVKWIWTADNINDDEVYFRFIIALSDMTPPDAPQGVKVTIP